MCVYKREREMSQYQIRRYLYFEIHFQNKNEKNSNKNTPRAIQFLIKIKHTHYFRCFKRQIRKAKLISTKTF